jgi:hypothetical protein
VLGSRAGRSASFSCWLAAAKFFRARLLLLLLGNFFCAAAGWLLAAKKFLRCCWLAAGCRNILRCWLLERPITEKLFEAEFIHPKPNNIQSKKILVERHHHLAAKRIARDCPLVAGMVRRHHREHSLNLT